MGRDEKTIDGFSVRRARDSKLVSRSKVNRLNSKGGQSARAQLAGSNDPLVKRTSGGAANTPVRAKKVVKKKVVVAAPKVRKTVANTEGIIRKRQITQAEAAEMFTSQPEAFNLDDIDKNELVREQMTEAEKQEAFLAPVESFDTGDDDNSTADGVISDVEDGEVIDMKKSKKELKKNEKLAKAERKKQKKAEKQAKKAKKSIVGKIFKTILWILLILIVGAGVYLYFWGDGIIKKITGGNGDIWSAISAVTSETYEPLKTDENGRTNILVFGTSGFDMEGLGEDGYTHDGAQLTDSIMVVSLDQENGDVAIVSLPRDLYAGYTCTATSKINEVYWCNNQYGDNESAGAEALQEKIKEILGIDTQYWVHMNWGALMNIVDAVGGITIVLDEDIEDYYYTGSVYQAGVPYEINGYNAVALSRARHGTEYGDFSRAASQQKILIGIKNKVVEKGLGLTEAASIVSALGDNLRMSLSIAEIKTGMHLLETFDLDGIRQIPLWNDNVRYMTFGEKDGISYIVPTAGIGVYGPLQEYLALQLKSNPAEREGAVIIVYNGSGEDGVAASERATLEEKGYKVREIANAPEGDYKYTEEIEIYDASEGLKPGTKKALERFYGVESKDMSLLPNGISPVGYDFIIIIGSAANAEE